MLSILSYGIIMLLLLLISVSCFSYNTYNITPNRREFMRGLRTTHCHPLGGGGELSAD
jgi:hypothetical protein